MALSKLSCTFAPCNCLTLKDKGMVNIRYLLNSGKNSKPKYYVLEYIHYWLPSWIFRRQRDNLLASIDRREDKDYIVKRADYYNKLDCKTPLANDAKSIAENTLDNYHWSKVYFFDSHHYLKYFPKDRRFVLKDGDVTFVPDCPALVKSRPIAGDNRNSVVLNLDKVRHFIFLKDKTPFRKKKDIILFRGDTTNKLHRQRFLSMYFNHPMCDLGDVSPRCEEVKQWYKPKITIWQHLDHKFIVTLEGNDVASNLKWVMSSNSIAVMPRPKYETWFMEGTLKPDYHYIEISPDYSDLIEKCRYYVAHPDEAEAIIAHAHEYVSQFFDKKREKLISLLVLDKYFKFSVE